MRLAYISLHNFLRNAALMILILTNDRDEHADLVCSNLDSRGQQYVRFHPDKFPSTTTITVIPGHETLFEVGTQVPGMGPRRWRLSDIGSVWFRRPLRSDRASDCSEEDAEFAKKESDYVIKAIYRGLEHCRWLNTPDQISRADCKPDQLAVAQSCGLLTPKTVITNDPAVALSFFDSCSGEVIYKQLSGYSRFNAAEGLRYSVYTNVMSRDDLKARADAIRCAPCLFQEYITKEKELRITIVGIHIFVAEIDSQASERSRIDWRHYDIGNTPYRAVEIPERVRISLFRVMKHYDLTFGCIDMIITPSGDYVFLELNPNGQWYWIEYLTGLPIAKCIADYLMFEKQV
jgi:glutathione synthase/RimK-type ligase-like ATP-grasp enzyme